MRRLFALCLVVVTGCAVEASPVSTVEFESLVRHFSPPALDVWEVAVCRVPRGVANPLFAPMADRMKRDSADLVSSLGPVSDYFARWSNGRYSIEWRAAAPVDLGTDLDPNGCVDRALDASGDETTGVLVVADAQHAADANGGWGRTGSPCDEPCPASESRRAVYVGAADFMPRWHDDPPLDLVEHELGHALGWPHSATAGVGEAPNSDDQHVYDSPYDVMSDSSAPRASDPKRRGAPGVLGVNLYAAGWIDANDIAFVDPDRYGVDEWHDAIRLVASDTAVPTSSSTDDARGRRLLVVPVGDGRFVTLEVVAARGDNSHLAATRVVVHLVESAETNEGRRNVLLGVIGANRSLTWEEGALEFRVGDMAQDSGSVSADVRVRRIGPVVVER